MIHEFRTSATPFLEAIADVRRWCAARLEEDDLRWSLRSAELAPAKPLEEALELEPYSEDIDLVVGERRRRLAASGAEPAAPALTSGRVLLWIVDISNVNGATEHESRGFLNIADTPPWDTWLGWFQVRGRGQDTPWSELHVYGAAWVPDSLVSLVEAARDVECMDMLSWADGDAVGDVVAGWQDIPVPDALRRPHHR